MPAASASVASILATSASANRPPPLLRAGPLTVERLEVLEDEELRAGDLRLARKLLREVGNADQRSACFQEPGNCVSTASATREVAGTTNFALATAERR
jgi:hypothetical protein